MYRKLPNLVIGFHGCSKSVFDKVIKDGEPLKKSSNSYDWLGNGIYFWEHNYQRAFEWAETHHGVDAAVIGAVIDLGYCLNLTDSDSLEKLKNAYKMLEIRCELTGTKIPVNRKSKKSSELLIRDLDCAVIQQIHYYNKNTNLPMYDSVRGIFEEGKEAYPGAAFRERTHVQLCICNPNCIKGYFSPLEPDRHFGMP